MLFHLYLPSFLIEIIPEKGYSAISLLRVYWSLDDHRRYIDNIGFKSVNHKQPPNFLIVYHAKCGEVNYKIVRKFVVLHCPYPKTRNL